MGDQSEGRRRPAPGSPGRWKRLPRRTRRGALVLLPIVLLAAAFLGVRWYLSAPDGAQLAPDELRDCDDAVGERGTIDFEPPRRMEVGRPVGVEAVVTLKGLQDPTRPGSSPDATLDDVWVRCFVRAELRGGGFTIDPPDARERSFLREDEARWEWEVEAEEPGGDRRLTLEVSAMVKDGSGQSHVAEASVYKAEIDVDGGPRSLWSRINATVGDLAGHPLVNLLFGGGVLVALLGYLPARRRKPAAARPGRSTAVRSLRRSDQSTGRRRPDRPRQ